MDFPADETPDRASSQHSAECRTEGVQQQQPDDKQERAPGAAGEKSATKGVQGLADQHSLPDVFETLAEVEIHHQLSGR